MQHNIYKIEEVNFSDDKYKSHQDEVLKSLFRKIRIKAFATGSNAHTLPINIDVLKRGSNTIYNQPILWKYNPYIDDAMSHEEDEVPCGFVPKDENNPIRFIEENGRTYLVIDALIWTKYSGRLIEIFERDNNKKDVSVEILCESVDHPDGDEITDYVVTGITILGEWINPAVEGCHAEMLQFSNDKDKFLSLYNFAESNIKIVNTKEASVDGAWENPRRKLLNPILNASNKNALLREAYLIPDMENPTTSTCKYPHHVVRDGKLVIHVGGLKAAFARAAQQDIVRGKVKAHLLRHYHELGLNTENFSEFGFSEEEFKLYFSKESEGEDLMSTQKDMAIEGREAWGDVISKVQAHEGKGAYVDSVEKDHIIYTKNDVRYRVEADVEVGKDDKTVKATIKWDTVKKDADQKMSDDAHKTGGVADEYDDDMTKEEDKKQKKEDEKDFADLKVKCAELEHRCAELEKSNKAYMAKCEAISDYEELKQFKCDVEAKMAQEEKMAKMEEVFSQIENKGIELSEDTKKEMEAKFAEYDNIDSWSNYAKAFAFDNAKDVDGITRIAYPTNNRVKHSIWDD